MKKYLFQLNHPAHYHLFKNLIKILRENGHVVLVTSRKKDILEELLKNEEHTSISNKYASNLLSKFFNYINREVVLDKIIKKQKPDLLLGTSGEIGHLGKINTIPSLFFGEDDVNLSPVMFLSAMMAYPFFSHILSSSGCNNKMWNNDTTFYKGFQKLAYLHPNRFFPDRSKVNILENQHYYLLRLSSQKAYHDINASGITNSIAIKIINLLEPYGKVLISSERPLTEDLEKYRYHGDLLDIHHYMFFADIIIGDSQSMSVEAAMLGVPNIRFNNFVGKISVLEELEENYGLSYGIISSNPDVLLNKIKEFLSTRNLKQAMQERRIRMLNDKIDVTAFFVWFIENFPESIKIMKNNPGHQDRFK